MARKREFQGPPECQELGKFVTWVAASRDETELARRFGGGGRSAWYAYQNGKQDIDMHVLEKMIKELVPARDVDSTIRRAIALHDRATRAREGRGQTLDVEPAPSLPLIVDAAAKVIWGDDRSVFLRDTNNELLTGELTPKELSWDETVPDSMVKRYPVNKVFEGSS